MMESYLAESIEIALDAMGIPDALTAEQREALARDLATSVENYGTFSGRDAIPNPLQAQMQEQRQSYEAEMTRRDRDIQKLEQHIAPLDLDPMRRMDRLEAARR